VKRAQAPSSPRAAPAIPATAAILAAALVLRAIVIARGHQLDIDEADTALKVAKPIGALLSDLARDGHPPLYFILLKGWTSLFGDAEAALRALSTLFSAAECALLVFVGRSLFGAAAGLYAGTLFALSPIEIFHATEGRMYTLLPLETLAIFAVTVRLLRQDRGPRRGDAVLLFALLAAALYTHNYGLFAPVAVCAAALAAAIARPREAGAGAAGAIRHLAAPALASAAAYVAYLPWLPVLGAQRASRAHDWLVAFFDATPPILAIPRSLGALAAIGPYPPITPPLQGADPLRPMALPIGLALLAAGVGACLARDARRPRDPARLALPIFAAVLLLAPWLVSISVKVVYLVGRYDIIALPFLILLLGAGAASLAARHLALAILPLAFAAAPVPGVIALAHQRSGGFAVEQAAIVAARPESRAVVATQLAGSRMRYYLRRAGRSDVLVRSFPTSTDAHPGWFERPDPTDPALAADADSLLARIGETLGPGEILWATLFDDDEAKEVLVLALARRFAADPQAARLDMGLIAVREE
jgi:hypothetical protein